ncbi:hypothetical protein [uncultured Eubacterium sp.]|uniref:hypothetical protein n=1 Tax=uncultured Eubacterium sp. TaxID=165185 RepID=UPI0025E982D8|nr:hypothetical protein [uncultured Eubacterium sp.]
MNYKSVLNEKVKEISTDKDFLFTVSKLIKTDEEAKSILDYIEQNNEDLFENVLSLVFEICESRKKYKS